MIAKYEAHVEDLAEEHDVWIYWVKQGYRREAMGSERSVWIGRCTSEWEYLTALHEIGHAVHEHVRYKRNYPRHGITKTPREVVHAQEVEAWDWAFAHARWPVTAATRELAAGCLRNYGLPHAAAAAATGASPLTGSARATERRLLARDGA